MKIITAVLSFTLILLAFASCKKDKSNNTTDTPILTGDSILYRIKKNSVIISEYTYNFDHTVKTITYYNDAGNFSSSCAFTYNQSARITRVDNVYSDAANNSYDSYVYNSGNLLITINDYCGAVQEFTQTLQYDSVNRLESLWFYYGGGMFGTNFIYGSANHVVKEYDSGDLVCDTTYYVYDNQRNIKIKGLARMSPDVLSANNIIQQTHNDQSGNPKPSDSYSSVFEFNSNGLPTKETRTYLNSTVDVYEYIYY